MSVITRVLAPTTRHTDKSVIDIDKDGTRFFRTVDQCTKAIIVRFMMES